MIARRWFEPRCAAAVAAVLVAACNGPTPSAHNPSSSQTVSATASPRTAGPCVDGSVRPAPAAGVNSPLPVFVVAAGWNQPDDLLFHEGSLYVGELGAGRIHILEPGRARRTLPVTIPKVEGMVFINGTLYVSNQQDDTVDVVEGTTVRRLLQLRPVAGQDGVDSISATSSQLVVPDSPNGVVDWVDTSGRIVRSVGGFVRPTGAWPLPDGSVLIADEFGNAAVKVAPDGRRTYLIRGLPIVDDIAADSQGRVFVVTPVTSGGRLAEVVAGGARDVVTGLLAPQGIAFDGADNIFVSESDRGRVDMVLRNFKLIPTRTAPVGRLCVDIQRAPGFTAAITFSAGPGISVVEQPGASSQGAVLVQGCPSGGCLLTASSGGLTDRIWIGG